MLLARTPEEVALVARAAPASARGHLTRWNRFAEASLILVTAGIQPNPSYRISVKSISILNAGKQVLAASLIEGSADASEGFTIPWVVVSVPAQTTALAKRCSLNIEGEAAFMSDCHGRAAS